MFDSLVQSNPFLVFWLLVLTNLVLGVLNALKDGSFTAQEFGDIGKKLVPGVTAFAVMWAGSQTTDGLKSDIVQWLGTATGGAAFATSIIKGLESLVGKQLPEGLKRWLRPKVS